MEKEGEEREPYIRVISETEVSMTPPTQVSSSHRWDKKDHEILISVPSASQSSLTRARTHSKLPTTHYNFAKVFGQDSPTSNTQASFFRETTLPMIGELLQGDSGLIFTYGVTNSGKSFTVLGGEGPEEAGLLPRAMDVIFNSIEGLESNSDIMPVGLYGVERAPVCPLPTSPTFDPWKHPSISKNLAAEASRRTITPQAYQRDRTQLKVDRNYRYSVWVSYVEVYNEKLFDLLDAGASGSGTTAGGSNGLLGGMTRSDSVRGSNWSIAGLALSATQTDLSSHNGPVTLNRRPLTLKTDAEGGGKYVAGLREIKVKDISEARDLIKKGQDNRVVFATMANRASSRSHGVFTIKLVREHAGQDPDESLACTVSRLSIVDLAGSERISATSSTGDRRKEAGNINKSLMCLGQCLETLRKNQARAASILPMSSPLSSIMGAQAGDDDSIVSKSSIGGSLQSKLKRRPSVVPFRHSKLTELFQPFFTGEGRTVMIVNANPYDTGFDENSHVMKFSAVVREVQTVRSGDQTAEKTVHRAKTGSSVAFPMDTSGSEGGTPPGTPVRRGIRAPLPPSRLGPSSPTKTSTQQHALSKEITVIEESDDSADEDEEDSADPFVDLLMTRHEELRQKLFEAESRLATLESEIRDEMVQEMYHRLMEMEKKYTERMLNDVETNEVFVNKKMELLVQASENNTPKKKPILLETPRRFGRDDFKTPRAKSRLAIEVEEDEVEDSLQIAGDEDETTEETFYTEDGSISQSIDDDQAEDEESDASILLQPGPSSKASSSRRSAGEEKSFLESSSINSITSARSDETTRTMGSSRGAEALGEASFIDDVVTESESEADAGSDDPSFEEEAAIPSPRPTRATRKSTTKPAAINSSSNSRQVSPVKKATAGSVKASASSSSLKSSPKKRSLPLSPSSSRRSNVHNQSNRSSRSSTKSPIKKKNQRSSSFLDDSEEGSVSASEDELVLLKDSPSKGKKRILRSKGSIFEEDIQASVEKH